MVKTSVKIESSLLALCLALVSSFAAKHDAVALTSKSYPTTNKIEQIDDYHGIKINDPYRWLEKPDTPETKAWVQAQNALTNKFLATIPQRKLIKERLTKLWNYERFGIPFFDGGLYFFNKNSGLQNQSVLYVTESLKKAPRVLLDPNLLSKDGTVAISGYDVSQDGKYLAYGTATSGSDWEEWRVRDIKTGKDLSDKVNWVKFSAASWTADGKGFFYSRYDQPNESSKLQDVNYFQKLYYHKLGTPQDQDQLAYERKDQKKWGFSGVVTDDGKYLVIEVWEGTDPKNRLFYKDLSKPQSEVVELLNKADARYSFIDNNGPTFYVRSELNAPKGKVIAIDTSRSTKDKIESTEIIPQAQDSLDSVACVGKHFICTYLKDARSQVKLFNLAGASAGELSLPGIGAVAGFTGKLKDKETFYSFTGFTIPTTIFRLDIPTKKSQVVFKPKVDFNPHDYTTKQVFVTSKDGTRIPMFISSRKDLKLKGQNACDLYAYGGFANSLTPNFSVARLVWMEMGGVYAVANLRGGSEYGEDWHQAGMKFKKQNVFDDFAACAKWLITNKYTSKEKLAISGGSNGGLLVGATITQHPELCAAAISAVGVYDMLRFHKFTIGWAWASEYGSSDNEAEFKNLLAYSPLHNVKKGTKYPAILFTTADHDDRVVPGPHSFKFVSTLQEAQAGNAPILIRIDVKAGHGMGKPTHKRIAEIADEYAFLVKVLNMHPAKL
jgi:prolyl oligopeptidase